ncbi:hypothetical protein BO86DRAFT_232536 [Aspergillus japonicus CBS 114.51]|uniref:Uncharacterized protein n=1 Tax=Aspergillus japonicus CBS 114.51 TaxID=1448312 RepID=A0A8T8WNC0_ASPJA|nr:hypothetical protein BO86DRAFT_232536 [Aspergillus japonicus CBS 114.51]RAH77112.1 hypothetical protein BO86DRAFT_232536 [Aspergillus japonicus CBS 114.51]
MVSPIDNPDRRITVAASSFGFSHSSRSPQTYIHEAEKEGQFRSHCHHLSLTVCQSSQSVQKEGQLTLLGCGRKGSIVPPYPSPSDWNPPPIKLSTIHYPPPRLLPSFILNFHPPCSTVSMPNGVRSWYVYTSWLLLLPGRLLRPDRVLGKLVKKLVIDTTTILARYQPPPSSSTHPSGAWGIFFPGRYAAFPSS